MKIKISGAPQTQFLTPLAGSFADLSCGVISQSSAGSFSYPAPAPATTRLLSWALLFCSVLCSLRVASVLWPRSQVEVKFQLLAPSGVGQMQLSTLVLFKHPKRW